ncbi:MAG: gliding motility-associated C-terminal domain-containing protein [Bernardetiaceae bacterium]|nr:gliding motility-associated C-terminal domain-containing protein [Bernardetiaceae bacterium]
MIKNSMRRYFLSLFCIAFFALFISQQSQAQCVISDNTLSLSSDNPADSARYFCFGESLITLVAPAATVTDTTTGADTTFTYLWQESGDGIVWNNTTVTTQEFTNPIINTPTFYRRVVAAACGESDTSNVIEFLFYPAMGANSITQPDIACEGQEVTIPGNQTTNAQRFVWQISNDDDNWTTLPDSTRNAVFEIPNNPTAPIFLRRLSLNRCDTLTSASIELQITPKFGEQILIPDSLFYCEGANFGKIYGNAPEDSAIYAADYSYRWQASADSAAGWNTVGEEQSLQLGSFLNDTLQFRRIATNPCGSDTSSAVTIFFIPKITNNQITNPDSTLVICVGDTVRLTTTEPQGGDRNYAYEWIKKGDADDAEWEATAFNTDEILVENLTDTTFFARIVSSFCHRDTSAMIRVDVIPLYGENQIDSAQVICLGDSAETLIGSLPEMQGNYRYQWQRTNEVPTDSTEWINIGNPTATAIDLNPGAPADTTYYRRVITGGCEPDTSNIVRIAVLPEISENEVFFLKDTTITVGGSDIDTLMASVVVEVCKNENITGALGSTPLGGDGTYEYQWQQGIRNHEENRIIWENIPDETNPFYLPQPLEDTTFLRRVVTSACFADSSNILRINVFQEIENNFLDSVEQSICLGTRFKTIKGSQPQKGNLEYEYRWQYSDTYNDSVQVWVDADSIFSKDYPPDTLFATRHFRRIVISACFTDTSEVYRVEVSPPFVSDSNYVEPAEQFICFSDEPQVLTGSLPEGGVRNEEGNYRYQWQKSEADSTGWKPWENIRNTNTQNYEAPSPPLDTRYRRIAIDECNIRDTSRIAIIRVWELPPVETALSAKTVIGVPVQLEATGAVSYEWSPAETLDNPNIANPIATPFERTTYLVIGTDENGCQFRDSVVVLVDMRPAVEVTNILTPDGDGHNDFLIVEGLERYPDNYIIIFNRWGQELLRIDRYENDWDGHINGRPLPEGEYFYILKFDITEEVVKGVFSVLR